MEKIAIVNAVRTPVGNFGGALHAVPAYDLAALVLNESVKRAKLETDMVDVVVMGQNYQSGEYVNIARMSLLKAGWPVSIPAFTLDRRCPSGCDSICFAAMMLETGNAQIAVAGGVESMSTAEFYLPGNIRWGIGGSSDMPRGHGSLSTWGIPAYDRILRARVMSQPPDRFGVLPTMMTWAETAAKEYGITREEVDKWALLSNQRACAAMQTGKFKEEITPIIIPQKKGEAIVISADEHPRPDTSLEALAKLKPVLGGVCTAGNSSSENDGAAVCVIMNERRLHELHIKPMAYLRAFAFSGTDPRYAWKSLTEAVEKALKKSELTLEQINLLELHEAFAAQTLANIKELGLTEKDHDRINVNGSCISLGHPVGATGARIMTTLVHEMQRRDTKYGLMAICGGGGMGICAILENV